jgi:hypothetical protein
MEQWSHSFPRGWIRPFEVEADNRLMKSDLSEYHEMIREARKHIEKIKENKDG